MKHLPQMRGSFYRTCLRVCPLRTAHLRRQRLANLRKYTQESERLRVDAFLRAVGKKLADAGLDEKVPFCF